MAAVDANAAAQVKMSIEDAFIKSIACSPGDPGAVNALLNDNGFLSAVAEYAQQEDLTFAKLKWPSRKGKGKANNATPTWLIVKGAHVASPGETWRIGVLTIPTRINLAFTPLQNLRPKESGRFSLSGCHVRLPRALVIALVETVMHRTVMKRTLDQGLSDELAGMVLDRSFINNHQRLTKIEFSSTSQVTCAPDVKGYYGSGEVSFRLQLRDRSGAIAKGSAKGLGANGAPANASLVLKAVSVRMLLGHGVESYWDTDHAASDGLADLSRSSQFAANADILTGSDKAVMTEAMIRDTATFITARYSQEVGETYMKLMMKQLLGQDLTADEKTLYGRFIVRIGTRARSGGVDDPEARRFGLAKESRAGKGDADPMAAYSRMLAAQVAIDEEIGGAADDQQKFSMGDTEDEGEEDEPGHKRLKVDPKKPIQTID